MPHPVCYSRLNLPRDCIVSSSAFIERHGFVKQPERNFIWISWRSKTSRRERDRAPQKSSYNCTTKVKVRRDRLNTESAEEREVRLERTLLLPIWQVSALPSSYYIGLKFVRTIAPLLSLTSDTSNFQPSWSTENHQHNKHPHTLTG